MAPQIAARTRAICPHRQGRVSARLEFTRAKFDPDFQVQQSVGDYEGKVEEGQEVRYSIFRYFDISISTGTRFEKSPEELVYAEVFHLARFHLSAR